MANFSELSVSFRPFYVGVGQACKEAYECQKESAGRHARCHSSLPLIVSTAPHRKPPHQTARRYPTHALSAIRTAGRDCTAVCGCVPRAILRLTNVSRIMLPVNRSCQSRGTKLVVDAPVCGEQNTSRRQSTGARARISMRESCFYIARYHHFRRSSFMLPSVTEYFF